MPDEIQEAPQPPPPRPKGRGRALLIVAVLGIAAAVGGYLFWQHAQTYETTDDAQINTHFTAITTQVRGTLAGVYVEEGQTVKPGQLLAEVDSRPYQFAVNLRKAELAKAEAEAKAEAPEVPMARTTSQTAMTSGQADVQSAEAAIAVAERDLSAASARLREAEANLARIQGDVARYKPLAEKDEIPRQLYEQTLGSERALAAAVDSNRAAVEAARKTVDQRRAQLEQARGRLAEATAVAPQHVAVSEANVMSKRAAADAARAQVLLQGIDLYNCKIYAPAAGIVAKRNVEYGGGVQVGQQLFTIAQMDDLWVTANFKETQLKRMHEGQRAAIHVDAFDRDFEGYIETMPAATGAVTSLLPPENATGNYVKVVQRMPVRIRFKKGQEGLDRLRPGMSVVPKVSLQ